MSDRRIPRLLEKNTFGSSLEFKTLSYITEMINQMNSKDQERLIKLINDVNFSAVELSKIENYKFYLRIRDFILENYYQRIEELKQNYEAKLMSYIKNFIQSKLAKNDLFQYSKDYKRIFSKIKSNDFNFNDHDLKIIDLLIKQNYAYYDSGKLKLSSKAYRSLKSNNFQNG